MAPISSCLQRHLVSEFNVQVLYLPGLQNIIANFKFRHSLLLQLTGDVAVAMAAALINFETMVTKQNRCPETQHLLGSSSLTVAFR